MKTTFATYTIILSIIYIISLFVIFKIKTKVKNDETKIYGIILLANLVGLFLHLGCELVVFQHEIFPEIFSTIIMKLYLFHFFIFASLFLKYSVLIIYDKERINHKLLNIAYSVVSLIVLIVVFIIPNELFADYENIIFYTHGNDVKLIYLLLGVIECIIVMMCVINFKRINKKKAIPILIFVLSSIVSTIIQAFHPEIVLVDCINTFTCLLMYFTIENPDAKIVEYEKNEADRARAASLAKSEFLSSMSHELRTPLNAIVGLSEDIDSFKESVPEDVKEDTKDIINASNTLLEIIGSILDISKIESGKLDIIPSDYDPKEEFDSLAKIMQTKFDEKNLEFNVSLSDNIPEVLFGDRLRIKQIINNLLSNACKYTDAGHVDFSVTWLAASGSLQIIVKDTGRGVKKEDIDKLFTKYDRLGVEKTSNVQGTGLGLAITKTLIDLMGGTISVDSIELAGTTFTVVLPQKLGNKEELERIRRENERKVEVVDYTGKRILVVDDNMLNIKVLKKAIKDFNFTIDECYNGREAISKIEMNNNYDLVLLDIKMPVLGGEETMAYLVNKENFITPVVALTADAMTGAKEKYTAIGFTDYLAKPFTRENIAKKITSILGTDSEDIKPNVEEKTEEKYEYEDTEEE